MTVPSLWYHYVYSFFGASTISYSSFFLVFILSRDNLNNQCQNQGQVGSSGQILFQNRTTACKSNRGRKRFCIFLSRPLFLRRHLGDIKKYVPKFVPEFIPEFVPEFDLNTLRNKLWNELWNKLFYVV